MPAVQLGSSWSAAGEQLAVVSSNRGTLKSDWSINACVAEMVRGNISILPLLTDYEDLS